MFTAEAQGRREERGEEKENGRLSDGCEKSLPPDSYPHFFSVPLR